MCLKEKIGVRWAAFRHYGAVGNGVHANESTVCVRSVPVNRIALKTR